MNRVVRVVAVVMLMALMLGTAIGHQAKAAPLKAAMTSVDIMDYKFSPASVNVATGDTVMWTNKGAEKHTVTADDGSWTSGDIAAGGTYSHTFTTAATVGYYCKYHGSADGKGMAGTVVVAAAMAATASVDADDQPAGATIVVKKVMADQDGFVTVHANTADNKPGDQLGHTAVKKGENLNVSVALSPAPKAGDKVWPMLHIDAGVIGTYEFPGADAPVIINGNIVMKQITLGAAMAATASVDADDQPAGATIVVKKVMADQDGFITVHANTADNKPGDQLGHTAVKKGENDNVSVTLSPVPNAGDKVWPMLHIDAGVIGTYEFPGPDAPVIINGNIVMKQITLGAAMSGPTASVEANDQEAEPYITVARVVAAQDGFITVHANTADNKPGDQLGHTAVKKGENLNVRVNLSPAPKGGDKVWPMLHIDAGVIGTYEFPGPDAPVIIDGNIVMKQITLSTMAMTPTTPSLPKTGSGELANLWLYGVLGLALIAAGALFLRRRTA